MVEELNPDLDSQEEVVYELIKSLQVDHLSRYEYQALLLLQNFSLSVRTDSYLIDYKISGEGCSSQLSLDGGKTFRTLGWGRIKPSSVSETKNLIKIFAESESRAILNI